ncbi:serine-threonine protein kinase, putative [Entamoeba invadens IP1]|uniref:serine-threonine protein kinase, putative n=1 Tax=Entamoeba invadens IP1 TaxID=370355 RepID=UPI0002C3D777|nr:serine-threonine protein kinase, putative [Entamoeba invadens IP1]ELP93506.1 serine-threonine protein kinase, putative [Entamoeba invadens IP1]|eukprot:XP_004260277.1 serine-threonine protein kinase, putative [Entamoeba invadens IP1]
MELYRLQASDILFDEKTDYIGKGCFGCVYKASLKGVTVAVKVPIKELEDSQLESYMQEMKLMNDSHSPNVVLFIGMAMSQNLPMFVTEFIKADLFRLIHSVDSLPPEYRYHQLDLALKIDLFAQCCASIQWIHNRVGLIHRDIKPANFLLDENFHVKACDFGFAESVKGKDHTFKGSPMYCSPEVLEKVKNIGKEIDIYALGITMWELFYEQYPFSEHPEIETVEQLLPALKKGMRPILPNHFIKDNESNSSKALEIKELRKAFGGLCETIPIEIETLMMKCWCAEPKKRPDINKLVDAVNDLKLSTSIGNMSATTWWKKCFEKDGGGVNSVIVEKFIEPLIKSYKLKIDSINLLKENIGRSNEVDLQRFEYLLNTYGKFFTDKTAFTKMVDVFRAAWWFSALTKDEALSVLDNQVDGTFLIRESTSVPNSPLTLSRRNAGQTLHTRILTSKDKKGNIVYSVSLKGRETSYDDVCTLIESLMALSVIKTPCGHDTKPSLY